MRLTALVYASSFWVSSLGAVGLSAQEPSPPARRWSVSGAAGPILGGPAASVRSQLEGIGWGGTSPGGCFFFICSGPTEYPRGNVGAMADLTVRYALTNRWALSVGTTGSLQLGDAQGYREGPDPYGYGSYLDSEFDGNSTWIAGHIGATGRLSAGAGVALHTIHYREGAPFALYSEVPTYRRVGLMGETSLRLPRASRLFWELTVRGHWIPGSVPWGNASVGGDTALDVGLSYATITTGVGLRF